MVLHTLFALSSLTSSPQQDSAWQIAILSMSVSAAATLIASIPSWIGLIKRRIRRLITYEVTDILFLPRASGATHDISVVSIKIRNASNILLGPNDYPTPIQFKFRGEEVGYCDIPEQFPRHTVDDPTTFFIKHPDPRIAELDKLMLDKIYLKENAYLTIRVHVTGSIEKSDIDGWGMLTGGEEVVLLDKRVAIRWRFLLPIFFGYITVLLALNFAFYAFQQSIPGLIFYCLCIFALFNLALFFVFVTTFGEKIAEMRQNGSKFEW